MFLPEPRGLCSFRPCVNYAPCGAAFTWLLWVFSIVGLGLTTYCMVRLRGPGSSSLAQIGMVDFVPGHAVIQAAQRKRVKYEAKCADIGYGFLSFSFSSFGELEQDAPCSACSRVFTEYIYGDHVVSCASHIGIKHRHNVVRDTLVDICFWSRILVGKEVDIGLSDGLDKPLRPVDMLLYSWDKGLDVCVDLTGSSPLTQTGMTDFMSGRAVTDATQCKRVKYEAKCVYISYGFLPFSFSSFGELEKDVIALLKQL
ncbi:hypothetical protein Tco_1045526 [Tanacetum coccineum]|uniref:Uncharacterized protein n=1 Tax=Tanacetum coccineum TaxID=301880 RepID=A0ABQ5GT25_9ASTR